eukprot:Plantae.Rhodophyta-Purpureofilum_apyrenoidigerum.ctg3438.p1 GENE.Plantae.Rhodophyta-Purpureofilum_apyrenoidigerum.ctg3438~~Plantae.Rhodophyta-Purpureofilum_apyrenoidigerum.ctg3438.p1  ORF type:complete len:525 (-),score=106.17 Plantae.Rhodophyta-Purpureofilum_apyrenoidigerum.ctg3438:1538-3112(-)
MVVPDLVVESTQASYGLDWIETNYEYARTKVERADGVCRVTPVTQRFELRTGRKVPKLGLMLVGWGGNNGSTLTASVIANRLGLKWNTKEGVHHANYFGSICLSSTVRMGFDAETNKDVWVPMNSLVPMVHPNDIVIGGWDINSADLAMAMERAKVLDYDLQRQVEPHLRELKPLPSIYYPDFIAANQFDRADNLIKGNLKAKHVERIREDIRKFKEDNQLDEVVVLWTANTERYAEVIEGVNDTAENLLKAIKTNHSEISPSTIFAVASILESAPYVNGSPQNTFVPGCVELATQCNSFIAGDDFKSGQTKLKSVMVDFLVQAGIKPTSIVSYNHLGNNDGKNLSAPSQFRSKEISKSNVVDDMVASNSILYKLNEHPDHVVVIKYVPNVGDSKRAMDEYTSEIFMGGTNTVVVHNTCEDSLLATPLILDLTILAELSTRVWYKTEGMVEFARMHPVLSLLSYMLKAPMVPDGADVVNALSKQRMCIENFLRALLGLQPESEMRLEQKLSPLVMSGSVHKNLV